MLLNICNVLVNEETWACAAGYLYYVFTLDPFLVGTYVHACTHTCTHTHVCLCYEWQSSNVRLDV